MSGEQQTFFPLSHLLYHTPTGLITCRVGILSPGCTGGDMRASSRERLDKHDRKVTPIISKTGLDRPLSGLARGQAYVLLLSWSQSMLQFA